EAGTDSAANSETARKRRFMTTPFATLLHAPCKRKRKGKFHTNALPGCCKSSSRGHMLMEIALADRLTTLAFLGLGGNVGDPAATMKSAIKALDARDDVTVEAVSSLYRTPPWGKLDQPDFINAVAAVRTS